MQEESNSAQASNNNNSTGPNEGSETVGGSLHVGRLAAPNK